MNYFKFDGFLMDYYHDLAAAAGGLGLPADAGRLDNRFDAFRHSLMSAQLTTLFGSKVARLITDMHEIDFPGTTQQTNMDRWNNAFGR